jgi:hypothetical protein
MHGCSGDSRIDRNTIQATNVRFMNRPPTADGYIENKCPAAFRPLNEALFKILHFVQNDRWRGSDGHGGELQSAAALKFRIGFFLHYRPKYYLFHLPKAAWNSNV